ncbi:MAG TPA: hypothetical protein VLL94_12195 [Nitrospiraceae bacterium]|nr:hypothetical protein [Nitrospiraceae bacterium]
MKQMLLTVSALALIVGTAFAETDTLVIDQRRMNQEQRMDQGVAIEQSNEREADRPDKLQRQVNAMESRAKSDGVMTEKERARILAAQDRAARHIEREKHVRKGKRHK